MKVSDFNFNGFLSPEIDSWTKGANITENEFYDYCARLNKFGQSTLHELNIHNENPQELLLSTLFLRSLSNYQGALILLSKGMILEARILIRSLLEILFRFKVISISQKEAVNFINQDRINSKSLIDKVSKLKNTPFELKSLQERKTEIEAEIKDYNIQYHGTNWYAKKAELDDYYNMVYPFLCNAVHSNVRDLESHLIIKDNKVTSFNYGPTTNELEDQLFLASQFLLRMIDILNDIFGLKILNELVSFKDELEKLIESFNNKSPHKKGINTETSRRR